MISMCLLFPSSCQSAVLASVCTNIHISCSRSYFFRIRIYVLHPQKPCDLYGILIVLFKYESFFRWPVKTAVDLVEFIFTMSMACLYIICKHVDMDLEIYYWNNKDTSKHCDLESNTCLLHLSVKYILNINCNMNFRTLTTSFGFSTAMWLVTVSQSDCMFYYSTLDDMVQILEIYFMRKVANNEQLYFLLAYIFKHKYI